MSIPPEEEKKSREKTVLFSNISHEFQTLITLMLKPLEGLLAKPDSPLTPEDYGQINTIHHNALRLLKLANMLLDISHIKTDSNQGASGSGYLAPFTEEAKRELETEIRGINQIEAALSESEERFRSAFDHAAIGMALVSPEGHWLKVNRSLCRILGYSEEELMVMDFHAIAHPDDSITDLAHMRQILNGEIDAYQIEKRYFHKLGHVVWTQLNVSLVRDYHGNPLYFISQIQDITERKRAEKELPESQKILAEAQRIAHLGSWDWDIQSNELSWSDEVYRIFGLSPRRFESIYEAIETFLGSVHPGDMELITKVAEEALNERKPYNIEHRILLPGGEVRIVHVQAEANFDDSGMPVRVIGTVHDITEPKRLEESVRENERLLQDVLDTLPVGVWIVNKDRQILQSNPAAQKIWAGVKYVEVVQYGEYKGWWADTGELIKPEEWALTRAITKGEVSLNEKVEIECFDGTHKIILNSALPIRNDYNEITGAIVVNQDITEQRRAEKALRESEERYRTLVENAPEAIVVLDVESGRFTDVNENAARLFQLTHDKLLSCGPVDLSPPLQPDGKPSSESALEWIQEAMNGGNPKFEWTHRNAEGRCIPCEVSLVRLPSTARTLIRGSIVDITDRKRMEEERLKLDKLESVGVLAGGIAHDFNNLLAAILTTVSLAKMNTHPRSDIYENLNDAEKACHQARRLTQQLLTFSRGGAPIKKLTSLKQMIEESPRFALRGSKSRCDFNIEEDLWDVEIDEGQISQVINNLIINADQAMPGGGLITVSAENVSVAAEQALPLRNGMYIKITVEDKGTGIPKEHLTRVFDPYFTTKQSGSGLGLATVYSIVKGHEGYVGVESELGMGTKFYIYLPASAERAGKGKREKKRRRVGRGKKANGRRVLLMDDEVIVRMAAGKALIDMGYDVEYAGDGKEAIEIYKKAKDGGKPFDVVIMDLTIPGGMGGKEAIGRLISIDPEVKAVVSSGYSNDPLMSEFRNYGFKGVIAKPYEIEELEEVLKKVLNDR